MKKLPEGISNYEELVNDGYYYVDKTKFIEKLEDLNNKKLLFLRPRKFGKSLFTSVLENYYDINKKDKFDYLFSDTYIGNNPTNLKNSYYVLKFNFSGIDTSNYESTIINFKKKVILGIKNFNTKYGFDFEISIDYDAEILLNELLVNFRSLNLDGKIYVIIDEYDHFANELLSFDKNSFEDLFSRNGKIRKFYEVLKEGTETVVDRIFITGVTPISLDSLTSGFNIASNISNDPRFNEMCGFTEEEILNIMDNINLNEEEQEFILPIMREYYDGYKFSLDSEVHVYNSNMCLYLLSHYSSFGTLPENLIDPNIVSDYKKLAGMFNLYKGEDRREIIQKSILEEGIVSPIVNSFSVKLGFDLKDFVSNLYYLGYLTITGEVVGMPVLKAPNEVMKRLYTDYFLSLVEEELGGSSIDYISLKTDLALNGSIVKLNEVLESLLDRLSNRDYQNFDEKYVKLLFYSLVQNFDDVYIVKSEYEVERKYPDLLLIPLNKNKGYYSMMIEFKYLKKTDENKLDEVMNNAKKQILEYSEFEEIKNIDKFRRYVIVCVNSKVYMEEVI